METQKSITKTIFIDCPDYQFNNLDLAKVGSRIDDALLDNFANKKCVLRGIQSKKHQLDKNILIENILKNGSDRYQESSDQQVDVCGENIDLFGMACKMDKKPISLPILEGFHKYKPKSLERPQTKVDIWMVYDANQLTNVEYLHSKYKVLAKDGYIFKNPTDKQTALLGIIVIN